MNPLVSVVIATHQRRELLRRALAALAGQTLAAERYEVVVVIDGSTDGTREMLAGLTPAHRLVVLDGPQGGRARAQNLAIGAARGEILVVLDDDMEPAPAMLERHAGHHPPGSRRCVMGGVPITPGPGDPRVARYMALKFNEHLERLARPDHALVPFDFYSGNTSLRTEVMREVGCFDPSFVRYGHEDVELFIRLRAAGVEVTYDPRAMADQAYGKGFRQAARDMVDAGFTAVKLVANRPEEVSRLPLGDFHTTSRKRIVIRAALLACARRIRLTGPAVFGLAAGLERAGLWRSRVFYEAAFDLAYWLGAQEALVTQTRAGSPLTALAGEVRRGPLDLLLHR